MADDGFEALEEQLGRAAPEGLRRLDQTQLHDLAEAVRSARRKQAAELAAAGDQALARIPRPLRIPIRRMFG